MKVITGQAPNLPWWKCLIMSDIEIAEYNNKFLKVEEMTLACETCNEPKQSNIGDPKICKTCGGRLFKFPDFDYKSVGIDSSNANLGQTKKGYAVNNMYAKQIWNDAIEAAARCVHNEVDAEAIRRLKK